MLGAIIGDIVGSIYEFNNIKTKNFKFFDERCSITDDTIMTVAVGDALTTWIDKYSKDKEFVCNLFSEKLIKLDDLKTILIKSMHYYGNKFNTSYGGRFRHWLKARSYEPYFSFGNGSAMRVSPVAYVAKNLEQVKILAKITAEVTHNHPEGIKGAEATAVAIFLALNGKSKEAIKKHINDNYYKIDFTLDEIRPTYQFNETCQETVPQAMQAFFESTSFEDAIRNAISIGGDSDTLAAITGSIAEAYYRDEFKNGLLNKYLERISVYSQYFTTDLSKTEMHNFKELEAPILSFITRYVDYCRTSCID